MISLNALLGLFYLVTVPVLIGIVAGYAVVEVLKWEARK
jgi:hypothetical protein